MYFFSWKFICVRIDNYNLSSSSVSKNGQNAVKAKKAGRMESWEKMYFLRNQTFCFWVEMHNTPCCVCPSHIKQCTNIFTCLHANKHVFWHGQRTTTMKKYYDNNNVIFEWCAMCNNLFEKRDKKTELGPANMPRELFRETHMCIISWQHEVVFQPNYERIFL